MSSSAAGDVPLAVGVEAGGQRPPVDEDGIAALRAARDRLVSAINDRPVPELEELAEAAIELAGGFLALNAPYESRDVGLFLEIAAAANVEELQPSLEQLGEQRLAVRLSSERYRRTVADIAARLRPHIDRLGRYKAELAQINNPPELLRQKITITEFYIRQLETEFVAARAEVSRQARQSVADIRWALANVCNTLARLLEL